jgi:hypothetical protein
VIRCPIAYDSILLNVFIQNEKLCSFQDDSDDMPHPPALAPQSQTSDQDALRIISEAMEGILTMSISNMDVHPLSECLPASMGTPLLQTLTQAVKLLSRDDAVDVLSGIRALGDVIAEVGENVRGCGLKDHELVSLKALAGRLRNPSDVQFHAGKKVCGFIFFF